MSSSATPQSSSGYASPVSVSPAPHTPHAPSKPTSTHHHSKAKPANVFSNDGSFLERFQHLRKDEEEKQKQEEIFARKRAFDDRFKQRGKRPVPPAENSNDVTEAPVKKPRLDEPLTQYKKEVNTYAGRSLKDDGTGVRPLVK